MEEKIKEIFQDVLNVKINDISDLKKMTLDSLDFINVLFTIESELGIKISEDDITKHKLEDMNNLLKYLETHNE